MENKSGEGKYSKQKERHSQGGSQEREQNVKVEANSLDSDSF